MLALADTTQDGVVGDLPDERVPERVSRTRGGVMPIEELRAFQHRKLLHQLILLERGDRLEQIERHVAAEHSGGLRDLLGPTEAVESRHQRALKTRRDPEIAAVPVLLESSITARPAICLDEGPGSRPMTACCRVGS